MANTEMKWRKMPRSIITDPNMDYIASCLPVQYQSAPYMFYMTALSIADDDGIFDIEDGIIFSRLMHVGDPALVLQIANLMLRRKIITRAGHTTKCMLTSWGYSVNEKSRTLEDRRKIVQRQIEAEQAVKSSEFTSLNEAPDEEIINIEFTTPSSDDDFLCPVNDKSAENVVNQFYDDKIQKNVVKNYETEKNREDKSREIEREEHTQIRIDPEEEPLRATATALRGVEQNEITEDYTDTWETETNNCSDMAALAEEALSEGKGGNDEQEYRRLFGVFTQFFAKNCLGFNENEHKTAIYTLCNRVIALSDQRNPPEIIASCLLSQFKKLTEDEGFYHNQPLTPEALLKDGCYQHALAACSRILLSNRQVNNQWADQLQLQKEIEAERGQVGDVFNDEYIKYGIDPNDPNKAALLVRAKSAATNGSTPP